MASSNQGNQGGGNQGGNQGGDTSKRGFASMDPERQREIASEGGRAAHESGNAHEFTSEEARKAGSMSHGGQGGQGSSGGGQGSSGGGQGGGKGGSSGGSGGGSGGGSSGGTRGGTPEQHAEAGRQSHKNDK